VFEDLPVLGMLADIHIVRGAMIGEKQPDGDAVDRFAIENGKEALASVHDWSFLA